jgi:hypothetical protein
MAETVNVAIMQPYFLPYIGYWQLINAVDKFVVYDNIEYSKKGWINRNRFLQNGKDELFTIPLKKDSDYLYIRDRYLSDNIEAEQKKILRRFENAYRKAPYYEEGIVLLKNCLLFDEMKLFQYIFNSIKTVCAYLDIKTKLVVSSELEMDHSLRKEQRVIATCKALEATDYINPIGGIDLYNKQGFIKQDLNLYFQQVKPYSYTQFDNEFVPHLSIVDVVMFNNKAELNFIINGMELIQS